MQYIQVLSVWERHPDGIEQCFVAFKAPPPSRALQYRQAARQEEIKKYPGAGTTRGWTGADGGEDRTRGSPAVSTQYQSGN